MKTGEKSFLNDIPDETGYIAWTLNTEPDWKEKDSDMEASLTIADCKKSLRFDFNVYETISVEERVNKIENIQQSLENFKQHLKILRN